MFPLRFFTLSFRSFSPMPGGIEFLPGRDYYFISTSGPGDLHNRLGGYCRSHNMKVVFKVIQQPVNIRPVKEAAKVNEVVRVNSEVKAMVTERAPAATKKDKREKKKKLKRKQKKDGDFNSKAVTVDPSDLHKILANRVFSSLATSNSPLLSPLLLVAAFL